MRYLAILIATLSLTGGAASAVATPATTAERVVVRLAPGQVAVARSVRSFGAADTVAATAFVQGRELVIVTSSAQRLDLAGEGAYVALIVPRTGPVRIEAVALRNMRLRVLLRW